jgi:hypothetical protein
MTPSRGPDRQRRDGALPLIQADWGLSNARAGAIALRVFGTMLDRVGSSSSGLAGTNTAGWARTFATLALGSSVALTTATASDRALRSR